MVPIVVHFNAYIPKSLGKTLMSYFENDPRFSSSKMLNYAEFKKQLLAVDSLGYRWLPEPLSSFSDNFFATDKVDFHNSHSAHGNRLSMTMNLDLQKIGRYSSRDKLAIFSHAHGKLGIAKQHSDASHRVKAYLREVKFYDTTSLRDTTPPKIQFEGICGKVESKTAKEKPFQNVKITNAIKGVYLHGPKSTVSNDTSIIEASASAAYPFLESVSPNIDFTLKVEISLVGNKLTATFDGEHNHFPAYELVVNGKVLYNYDPAANGFTNGPTPNNLGNFPWDWVSFHKTVFRHLDDHELREIQANKKVGMLVNY